MRALFDAEGAFSPFRTSGQRLVIQTAIE